ncbi:glutamate receptor-interacting protein 2-like [Cynoglossus semilaevis]|uniref:glutamate receptor-interacting protein 2-like n=1 Tax=Cynoglossus semilaevis TaxID=244447 RepID=UPI000D630066|nr:glutamate receptor-interacting protein 2-like [Cynoglossus semilaevis]
MDWTWSRVQGEQTGASETPRVTERTENVFMKTGDLRKNGRSSGTRRRMFSFSLRCRLGVIRGRDEGPYSKGPKESGAAESRKSSLPEECRGVTTVELMKREGSGLGLTISGGSDKDARPRVLNLRPGGLAARSDQLNVGDYIRSVNGINLSKLRHDEIIRLLKNIGERVVLEVEYELPQSGQSPGTRTKTMEVCLHKEGNSFGFVMRGGFHEDWRRSRPLVVTYVRPGGPADREGTLRAGDRVLSIDGMPLHREKHADALTVLMQSSQEALFLIEYDVSVHESVQQASGPLLVEIVRGSSASLGISLTTTTYRGKQVVIIDKIKTASVVDRCGALRPGDVLLSINGTSTDHCSLMEATQLLANTPDTVKLEVLPANQSRLPVRPQDTVKVQKISHPQWDQSSSAPHCQLPHVSHGRTRSSPCHLHSQPDHRTVVSGGFSPSSTVTSGFSSQGSNTLPCPIPPTTPSSPRGSTGRRRNRRKDHKSSLSLSSRSVGPGGQVFHVETSEVFLRGDPLTGFGLQLQGGVFATEALSAPPVVHFIEPDSPAERCGLLTDVESVVPSSGTFYVKLPKRRDVELGITISASKKPGTPLIISDIRKGSTAHRTGTLEPGDRLLAIDNLRLENSTVEDAVHVLQQAEDMVKLRIQKDEDNIDELEMSDSIIYTVELKRYNGPLGITISGTEEPFDPIVISGLTRKGLAERTGAIHVGDRVLAINGVSLKGKPLSKAIHHLQMAGESVTLKIKKQVEHRGGGFLSDTEDELTDFNRNRKHSELYSATGPSTDSAMSSWDSLGFDAGYGHRGSDFQNVSDTLLDPNDWKRSRPRNQTRAPSAGSERTPLFDSRLSEDEADAVPGFISPRCRRPLTQDNDFWSLALQDLETCGQSQILRELEASMTGSCLSLYLEETRTSDDSWLEPETSAIKTEEDQSQTENNLNLLNRDPPAKVKGSTTRARTTSALTLHKISVRKDLQNHDFGFSVSDGLLEKGVFINMIRPDGPADQAGLKSLDRILQVNCVRTRDLDCGLAVPLLTEAGDSLDLVVSRTAGAASDGGGAGDGEEPSDPLHCFHQHQSTNGSVAV